MHTYDAPRDVFQCISMVAFTNTLRCTLLSRAGKPVACVFTSAAQQPATQRMCERHFGVDIYAAHFVSDIIYKIVQQVRVVSVLDSGAEGPGFKFAAATLSGNSLGQTVHTHRVSGFMTHVTCELTAKNRDQLRNPTLGNRVRVCATFIQQVK